MDVTDDNFEEKVIKASEEKPVIVDFWASWCVPCNILGPLLESVIESYNDKVVLVKVNVDECPNTSNKFSIDAIPAVKIFKDGKEVDSFVGVVPEDTIKNFIEKHI